MNLAVSQVVDGQIYTDLGFAEILYYQRNISPIYYATVKVVEKSNGTSSVTIHTGGQPAWASRNLGNRFIRWASGGVTCD